MPLSKTRDKARKRKERAKVRLDKLLFSLKESKPVQPKPVLDAGPYWGLSNLPLDNQPAREAVEIDADGNQIYGDD